jgi:hypothetical protein
MNARFAYAQARIQAHYALLADAICWRHLQASRFLSSFLEEARTTSLAHWVGGLSQVSGPHHIEQALLHHFHSSITQASAWMPENWRAAVLWTAWAAELPLLNPLTQQQTLPEWARQSPMLGPLLSAADAASPLSERLAHSAAAPLLQNTTNNSLEARWLSHWQSLWPSLPKRHERNLARLIEVMNSANSETRGDAQAALQALFRRAALQPAALFTWLALLALEYRRLRGALITRAVFTTPGAS